MDILFDKRVLAHNPEHIEGAFRLSRIPTTIEWSGDAEQLVRLVHSEKYVKMVRYACEHRYALAEINVNKKTLTAAYISAGLAVTAADNNAFAVCRPPGHHASREKAMGFCLFNNVAIATQYLVQNGKRVCIVDIDGHHGNGTQSIFNCSKDVCYLSVHQQNSYPNTGKLLVKMGREGNKIVIPLPKESGDDLLVRVMELFAKYIDRFNPDHIALSAGFDGFREDRLLQLNYSLRGYYAAAKTLASLGKPTFAVLEGGYHGCIPECISSLVDGFSGKSAPAEEYTISTLHEHDSAKNLIEYLHREIK